ncbi:olfactory receptor 1G1-like [Gracilinanus agilis]|uniref:olfactory receptor 1G1-like n=1 Tax=Gracilinanus agilis TaxID=191870 RepID=UPI001CFCA875|nr:olfactory receptor 1G1-like [Gracilinanus agilis]XP_044519184.1 olfactory receptor 1G1-like [Gracilinanus agilis]
MGWKNQTTVSEFILLGLFEGSEHQQLLFWLFLLMYLITVIGNLLIIVAVGSNTHLHTPMYFFLANLSFADINFISTTVPKVLMNSQTQNNSISYSDCLTQLYFFIMFGTIDEFLLATMAYDRYVAICHPLHYTIVMTHKLCFLLISIIWVVNVLHSLLHTLLMNELVFCAKNEIPHFFCDLNPLLKLSCSDIFINELMILTIGGLAGLIPFLCVIISYVYIVLAILRIPSAKGKQKAFSTCSSHLSVVSLFFGTVFGVYFSPSSNRSAHRNIIASIMYTVVTPMLNPFIYSLRNREMKAALRKLF